MNDLMTNQGGTQLKDFLSALVIGLQTNATSDKQFESDQIKHAKWNGQKIVLQSALNDLFGVTSAPYIIIESNQSIGTNKYFFRASELSPVYFKRTTENDPVYFFRASELPSTDYDFLIKIPSGLATAEFQRRVSAQATLYKLAGTAFKIVTY